MDFDSKLLDIQRRVNSLNKEHGSLTETTLSAGKVGRKSSCHFSLAFLPTT